MSNVAYCLARMNLQANEAYEVTSKPANREDPVNLGTAEREEPEYEPVISKKKPVPPYALPAEQRKPIPPEYEEVLPVQSPKYDDVLPFEPHYWT